MKGTGKIIIGISFAACFLLLYVHEQISLFRVSYILDNRSEKLSQMSEEYRQLKFELDQLKAPRLLEEKIKDLSLDLALPKEVRVFKVTPTPVSETLIQNIPTKTSPLPDRFVSFLGRWVEVAQAKTDN